MGVLVLSTGASNQRWLKYIHTRTHEERRRERQAKCLITLSSPWSKWTWWCFDCKYWIKFHSKLITSNWSLRFVPLLKASQSHYRASIYTVCVRLSVYSVYIDLMCVRVRQIIAKRVQWHIIFNQLSNWYLCWLNWNGMKRSSSNWSCIQHTQRGKKVWRMRLQRNLWPLFNDKIDQKTVSRSLHGMKATNTAAKRSNTLD